MARTWLRFDQVHDTGRTRVWHVVAREGGTVLGVVRWFPRWRAYAFFPAAATVFEPTCLGDIAVFIKTQMEARKSGGIVAARAVR